MSTPAAASDRSRLLSCLILLACLVTAGYLVSSLRPPSRSSAQLVGGILGASAVDSFAAGTAAAAGTGTVIELAAVTRVVAANQAAVAVFTAINLARRKAGAPPLRWITGLYRSALVHNFGMARSNELSHQLANEPDFSRRITAQRVEWKTAGENIGWTSDQTSAGAVSVNASMLAELAPNDGHRRNILSMDFTAVGVNVVIDQVHHRMWLTEDFVRS